MQKIKKLWTIAVGEIPADWNADNPSQRINALDLWLLSLICMYGIFIGEFYSVSGNPVVVGCYRFIQHGCIPLCALGVVLSRQNNRIPWMALLSLGVATIPFFFRMGFEGKLQRRHSGLYFEEHFVVLIVPLLVSLGLSIFSCWRDNLSLEEWGLGQGDWRWWLPRTGIVLAVLVPALIIILHFDANLADYYPIWREARESVGMLMLSNGSYAIDMLSWEMLFRGIILFGYARRGDPHTAIWAQTVPFFFLHASKPDSELIGSLFGGLICGWFCLRARSFWPLFILHWLQLVTVNSASYAIRMAG